MNIVGQGFCAKHIFTAQLGPQNPSELLYGLRDRVDFTRVDAERTTANIAPSLPRNTL